jgi:hypothetical protein
MRRNYANGNQEYLAILAARCQHFLAIPDPGAIVSLSNRGTRLALDYFDEVCPGTGRVKLAKIDALPCAQ